MAVRCACPLVCGGARRRVADDVRIGRRTVLLQVDFEGVEQHGQHGKSPERADDVDDARRAERSPGGIERLLLHEMILEHLHGEGVEDPLLVVVERRRATLGDRLERVGTNSFLDRSLRVGVPGVLRVEEAGSDQQAQLAIFGCDGTLPAQVGAQRLDAFAQLGAVEPHLVGRADLSALAGDLVVQLALSLRHRLGSELRQSHDALLGCEVASIGERPTRRLAANCKHKGHRDCRGLAHLNAAGAISLVHTRR